MTTSTRRSHLKSLIGMAVLGGMPLTAHAAAPAKQDKPLPPRGIGKSIKHISYSDQGGRPDGVQVMYSPRTKHVFVGHMFSDGITVLDANDPR